MKSYAQQLAGSLLLLQTAIASESSATGYQVIEDKASLPILTPALKDRKTLKIRLNNGLEAYLISDPGVHQSAAALSVKAGSWNDPQEYPGMAHFCEHMLFMGNKAYPDESDYWKYILDNGGKINAATYSDHTSYYFSVNNDAYFGAIDRFSHFFIDPLFAKSGIDRELHAVDQEHAKNIENDGWRQYMVLKETANDSHPIKGFSTGNAKTLGGIPTETLKQWYQNNYSADQMSLLVISAKSLEELTPYIVSCFSNVPKNADSVAQIRTANMTSENQRGHMLYLKPIKDLKQLSLLWEIPKDLAQDNDRAAASLIAYALGNESGNSLLQQLKNEKIAEGLSVSADRFSKKEVFFNIDISLTEQGLTQIDTAIMRVFQAIADLKQTGIPISLFEERKKMAEIGFQYQSREDAFAFVMANAFSMLYEDIETFPMKSYTYTTYDPSFINAYVDTLTPESCLYIVTADPDLLGIVPDRKEKWMQAEYALYTIPEKTLLAWKEAKAHPDIGLVKSNPFIPEKLEIMPEREEITPFLIANDSMGKIYFAPDALYHVPEAAAIFNFKTPKIDGTAHSSVLIDLYLKALQEKLSSTFFFAQAGGLSTNYSEQNMQLTLFVQGYSEKMPLLLKTLFQEGKEVVPTVEQFNIYKQSLLSSYDNASKELAFFQARELIASFIFNDCSTYTERLKALHRISYEDFVCFSQELFKKIYVEGLFYGNIQQNEADILWSSLKTILAANPYPKDQHKNRKVLLLPETHGPYMVVHQTQRQGNAALLLLEEGSFSFDKRAIQQILSKALNEAFFATLRTKQQTGYIAAAWDTEVERQLLQYFGVQSNTHSPSDLLARFELFLEDFLKNMQQDIPQERFDNIRNMLITTLEMPPENMQVMARKLSMLAFDYNGDFEWFDKRIESLKNLTYDQFLESAHAFLSRGNARRLAVLVEGVLPKENQFRYEEIAKEDIGSLGNFVSWRDGSEQLIPAKSL